MVSRQECERLGVVFNLFAAHRASTRRLRSPRPRVRPRTNGGMWRNSAEISSGCRLTPGTTDRAIERATGQKGHRRRTIRCSNCGTVRPPPRTQVCAPTRAESCACRAPLRTRRLPRPFLQTLVRLREEGRCQMRLAPPVFHPRPRCDEDRLGFSDLHQAAAYRGLRRGRRHAG